MKQPEKDPKRSPRPGVQKEGQKSLFLIIPRHIGGAKRVFSTFRVFEGFEGPQGHTEK